MATLRARVELEGSVTHTAPASAGGRVMVMGRPEIITEPAHIQYYRSQAGFSVTILEAKKAAAPEPPPPAEPEPEEDFDEDGLFDEDDQEDEGDEEEPEDESDEPATEPVEPAAAKEPKHSKTELLKLKKPQLAAIADSLGLSTQGKVMDLVKAILGAQG